jgi:WD40 repeat protein
MLETAGSLCDNAFSKYNPDVPLISGSAASPVFTLKAIGEEEERPGSGPWSWSPHPVLDTVEAPSAETVRAIVCIMEMRKQVGKYDSGSPAYRPSWIVLLLQWPDGNLFGREYFIGGDPPKTKSVSELGIGDEPTRDFSEWLLSVTDKEKILHPGPVESVVFSPDGQTLAVGGAGGAVHLWDLEKEEEAGPLLTNGTVYGIAYSPDGQNIASGGWEEIRLWEVATGGEISLLKGSESARFAVAYSPDGEMLATGSKKVISFLDAETREETGSLTAGGYVSKVAFSPDGQTLAAKLDETVEVWDVGSGELRGAFGIKKQKFNDFDISPDGKTVAMGFRSGVVKQWDMATGKEQVTQNEIKSRRGAILSVAYSPDGKLLATGDGSSEVGLWEAATGELIRTYEGHSDTVQSVNFSPDGQKLASGSADGTVMIWDVEE